VNNEEHLDKTQEFCYNVIVKNPELLLIGGKPFSGKSSISRAFVDGNIDVVVRHLSMGDRLRAINKGEVESRYSNDLATDTSDLKAHKPIADKEKPIGVFEEFIEQEPADLYILDAFPRYPDRLDAFRESIQGMGARILAVCLVDVPDELSIERSKGRAQRYDDVEEDEVFVRKRLDDFRAGAMPVLAELSRDYPYYVLDGTKPITDNVAALDRIYQENK